MFPRVTHNIMITLNTRRQLLTAIFISVFRRTHISTLSLYVTSSLWWYFFSFFFRSARFFFYFQSYQSLQMIIGMKSLILLTSISIKYKILRAASSMRENFYASKKTKGIFWEKPSTFSCCYCCCLFYSPCALLFRLKKKIVYVVCAGRKQHCKNGRNIPNTRQ